jgi:hypothetical protein
VGVRGRRGIDDARVAEFEMDVRVAGEAELITTFVTSRSRRLRRFSGEGRNAM